MSRMKYVQRRANRFEFRYALPDDLAGRPSGSVWPQSLAPLINAKARRFKRELIRALQTRDTAIAERRALAHISQAHTLVDEARRFLSKGAQSSVSAEQVQALAREHELAMLNGDEQLRFHGLGLDMKRNRLASDGQGMTDDDLKLYAFTIDLVNRERKAEAAKMRAGEAIALRVNEAVKRQGICLHPDDPDWRKLELAFVAAEQRAFDSIGKRLQGEQVALPAAASVPVGLTVTGALTRWAEGGGRGARKPGAGSVLEARDAARRFVEMNGDLPISSVTRAHARALRDALGMLPKNLPRKLTELPLPQLLKREFQDPTFRSAQTINKMLALLGGVFARAERDGYFDDVNGWSNPFRVHFEIAQSDMEPYEPFSSDELRALFASPVFCAHERPRGGRGDAAFWFPLISLYSGARRTEIAQLKARDLRQTADGIWFFDVTDAGDDQSLKTASSVRSVPLHSELIRLGLIRFACERVKSVGPNAALWAGFEPPVAPKAAAWSKWFARYLGEHVTTKRSKTFHSFRHTFKRACREAGVPEEIHHALTGHAATSVGQRYGRERKEDGSMDSGVPMYRLALELNKVRYDLQLREHDGPWPQAFTAR